MTQYVAKIGAKRHTATLPELSAAWESYRDSKGFGMGRVKFPAVRDLSGNQVGYIAYNGRIFAGSPSDWKPGAELLFDNRA